MTKQEKLREGIADYLRENDGILCLRATECEGVDCADCQADGLINYLHSQGLKFVTSNCDNCPKKEEDDYGLVCAIWCRDQVKIEEIV